MDNFFKLLSDIVVYLSWFYPILYIKGFAKNSKAFKIFTVYLVGIAIVQFLLYLSNRVLKLDSNLFLFIYYFIFQFLTLSFFYKTLLGYRWIYVVTGIALLFFGMQYINDPQMYYRYNPLGVTVSQSIIVLYTLLYFYRRLSSKGEFLIVNVGVFFYLLSSILIFASGNLVFNLDFPRSTVTMLGRANNIFFFIFQILIMTEWFRNYFIVKKPID
ncbi:hypothetical protein [Ulvibacter antarcticus]|uniref:YhhN-like protein n=1 Tax=Ulvibacter antarcticus TaxID=442714 RepID=A0A3L9YL27_9FLAO|nr:hypothetical protein [Ulvibacter antarcticus]RMA58845.1 hypothetical protein BXY75_2224 [Ulvibacter antarcticus]